MVRDPLKVLSVVRQRAVDQQRQALAACLRAEAAAEDRIERLEEAVRRDQALTEAAPDKLLFHDVFITARRYWRSEQQVFRATLAEAARQAEQSRAALAAARLAAEAVDCLIAEHEAAARTEADRQAQHVLDDIARGLRK